MKLQQTAKIKLNIPVEDILPSLILYTKAFNFVCEIGFNKKCFNGVTLHNLSYQETREYLPAQLAISARMKATEAIKSVLKSKLKNKSCPKSKLCCIRLDVNSYSLFLQKQEVSILTTSGRKRYPLVVSDYHQHYFKDWKYTSADLVVKNNKVYLHIAFEKEIIEIPSTGKLVGIDRGINNIAVTSLNQFYGGGILKNLVNKQKRLRKQLQSKGTKSAKRHLKKLSKKEKQFRADINHQISRKIINSLNPGDTIVLEELTGIRNKRIRKPQRILINNWGFYQLEQFLIYKAKSKSIRVEYIDARYTSQMCSKCSFIAKSNRKTQSGFCCKKCGFKLNADLNASRNICAKAIRSYKFLNGVEVNLPNGIGSEGTNFNVGTEMLLTSSHF